MSYQANSMLKPQVIFRVEANEKIGLGHFIRCMALADMLVKDYSITFCCIHLTVFLQKQLHQNNLQVKKIKDEEDFLNHLQGTEIVVLDGYQFASADMQNINNRGNKLVFVDDLHPEELIADCIINQNPASNTGLYDNKKNRKYLLGFDYALLRKPFLQAAENRKQSIRSTSVMISMGGADPYDFCQAALNAVLAVNNSLEIHVIVSPFKAPQLKTNVSSVHIHSGLGAEEMAALMLKSEFIICPASSLCFEALACGIKIIGGYFEENQKEFYRYLAEKRIIFGLGNLKDLNINSWTDSLEHAFAFFKDKQHQFGTIDGKQGERFRKAFMELNNE